MPDKKLTDSEITIKALKEILDVMLCEGDLQRTSTINHAIDLINRLQAKLEKCEKVEHFADKTIATLQAENKRLSTLAELGNKRANDYRVMRDRALKAEAEIERLEAECDKQYEIAEATIRAEIADGGTSCHWCEDIIKKNAKSEAYKEFAEKLAEKAKTEFPKLQVVTVKDINSLLKELVGEGNGKEEK